MVSARALSNESPTAKAAHDAGHHAKVEATEGTSSASDSRWV